MNHASRFTFLIFLAAILPRLYALGGFLTIDEVKWAEGAAQFLLALSSGDLAQTYWHFFPGVTLAWGGALTLWSLCLPSPDLAQCVQSQVEHLPDSIGWLRLTPVLLTSLGIAGVYGLGRKLVTGQVALLAALLLAFDPFFIAHARILNGDAITAVLMFLSLLSFLNGMRTERLQESFILHPSSFIFSAVLAGLALLTKLPAPIIGLFIGGLGLVALAFDWPKYGAAAVRRWMGLLALWGGIALAVVFLLWPALWVAPAATLQQMYGDSFEVGELGEGHDAFFMGQVLDDPGPWFYPYAIAFRLTPVVMVGLVLSVVWLVVTGFRKKRLQSPELTIALINLGFIVFIILLANLSPKKLDRYVIAVIPPLLFWAAQGFGWTWQNFTWLRRLAAPLLAGLVILHLIFAILAAPYYLTYYNPLLGGVEQAARQLPVGWGEGLEQAAAYLNSLPGAETLTVSSWYSDIFQLYFAGQRTSFSDDGRGQLSADYVVFYINQWQRQKPYPELVNYFRTGEPVFSVKVGLLGSLSGQNGVNWVEVYKAPAAQSASGGPKIEGVAQLLAYKIATDQGRLSPGETVGVTLFLRVLGPLPEKTRMGVSLANPVAGTNYGSWRSLPWKGEWRAGSIVEWPGELALPADLPAGDYRFAAALQNESGAAMAEFAISEKDPLIRVE